MNKDEILEMAHKYSKNEREQKSYMAGFQAACNVVRCKINTCDNSEFYDEMEELAQVAFMDLDISFLIKTDITTEQIIFNLLNKSAHTWLRYWKQKEMSGLTMPGEYVEMRIFFFSGTELSEFLEAGFKIHTIQSKKIDADAYCDILLIREIN